METLLFNKMRHDGHGSPQIKHQQFRSCSSSTTPNYRRTQNSAPELPRRYVTSPLTTPTQNAKTTSTKTKDSEDPHNYTTHTFKVHELPLRVLSTTIRESPQLMKTTRSSH
eukprot:Trichotokara_eunicae@DN75_c0_g1_i1.p1